MVGNAAATAAAVVDDVVGKVATVNVTVGTDCHTREFQLQTVLIGDHCQNLAIWICGIIENDDIIMPFVRIPFLRAKDKLHSLSPSTTLSPETESLKRGLEIPNSKPHSLVIQRRRGLHADRYLDYEEPIKSLVT